MNKFPAIAKADIRVGQQIMVVDPYSEVGEGEHVYVALSDGDGFSAGWVEHFLMSDVPKVVKKGEGLSVDGFDRLFRFAVWGAGVSFIVFAVAVIGGAIGRGL